MAKEAEFIINDIPLTESQAGTIRHALACLHNIISNTSPVTPEDKKLVAMHNYNLQEILIMMGLQRAARE